MSRKATWAGKTTRVKEYSNQSGRPSGKKRRILLYVLRGSWLALEGDEERKLLLIPFPVVETLLPRLGVTEGAHWHLIVRLEGDRILLWLRGGDNADLTEYAIAWQRSTRISSDVAGLSPNDKCYRRKEGYFTYE